MKKNKLKNISEIEYKALRRDTNFLYLYFLKIGGSNISVFQFRFFLKKWLVEHQGIFQTQQWITNTIKYLDQQYNYRK